MSTVTIRNATEQDLPAILEIYNEAVLNKTATYDCEPRTMDYRLAWFEDHVKHNFPVLVATATDGHVLGWSALNPYQNLIGYRFTAQDAVYIAADQRGRGVGRLLLPRLIEAAHLRGLHAILAAIDADNEACIQLHASFGFVHAGLFKQVGFKFGRWIDVVSMERLL